MIIIPLLTPLSLTLSRFLTRSLCFAHTKWMNKKMCDVLNNENDFGNGNFCSKFRITEKYVTQLKWLTDWYDHSWVCERVCHYFFISGLSPQTLATTLLDEKKSHDRHNHYLYDDYNHKFTWDFFFNSEWERRICFAI